MKTLVLGLGNDLIADDGVGLAVAEAVGPRVQGLAEVRSTCVHGIALMDEMVGYHRVILVDACRTGDNPPGSVFELTLDDLSPVIAPSPHYAGLPEMIALASQLGLQFPEDVTILAVEAVDLETVGGAMTPSVRSAIPELCDRIVNLVKREGSRHQAA